MEQEKKVELTAELYHELLAETGLTALVDEYAARGYQFISQLPSSPLHTSISKVRDKQIWLSAKDLNNSRYSRSATFMSIILHELGHAEAAERGLDHKDEVLAWRLAAEISPVPLPAEWPLLRSHALTTYKLRMKGELTTPADSAFIQEALTCAVCRSGRLYAAPTLNFLEGNGSVNMAHVCLECQSGYVFTYRREAGPAARARQAVLEGIYHWNVPPEDAPSQ